VALTISTAAATGKTDDSPFILVTVAPLAVGLNCRFNRPIPTARRVFAQRTLQGRQVHTRFAGEASSS
jgi:hypothetical protein